MIPTKLPFRLSLSAFSSTFDALSLNQPSLDSCLISRLFPRARHWAAGWYTFSFPFWRAGWLPVAPPWYTNPSAVRRTRWDSTGSSSPPAVSLRTDFRNGLWRPMRPPDDTPLDLSMGFSPIGRPLRPPSEPAPLRRKTGTNGSPSHSEKCSGRCETGP